MAWRRTEIWAVGFATLFGAFLRFQGIASDLWFDEAYWARALITGRSLPEPDLERLRGAVLETPGVDALNHLAAIHSGASEVLVDLDLDLAEGLETTRIEALLDDVEARVRRVVSETTHVRVELNSLQDAPDPAKGT